MKIEYRISTRKELYFSELTTLIEDVEYVLEDIVKNTIGEKYESYFRGIGTYDCVLFAYDTEKDKIAGVVVLEHFYDYDQPFCNLNNLYVKNSYCRHGIGSELVIRAISKAREAGKKVTLTVLAKNEIGQKFWGKVGHLKPISTDYVVDYEKFDAEEKKC